jgi:hypothetical protein
VPYLINLIKFLLVNIPAGVIPGVLFMENGVYKKMPKTRKYIRLFKVILGAVIG